MGAQSRADLGLTADLGQVQYLIDQARLNAVPTQLQVGGSLYGAIPTTSYIGQNSVSTTNPGVGGLLAGLGGAALSGWASGGFQGLGGVAGGTGGAFGAGMPTRGFQ